MTLREYLDVIARRKWVIIVILLASIAVAVVGTFLAQPRYQASATLRVLAVSGGTAADWVAYDTRQLDRLMSTYAEFAVSRPVLQELVEELGLTEWPQIEVKLVPGTELIEVSAEAASSQVAMQSANALAEILISRSRSLYTGGGKSAQDILGEQLAQVSAELDQTWTEYETLVEQSPNDAERIAAASRAIELKENTYGELLDQYERNRVREALLANTLSVVEPAAAPRAPAKPRKLLNIALGLAVGLAGGVSVAFLIENLDTAMYSDDQIKRTANLPILGSIPNAGKMEHAALFEGISAAAEALRRLRTSIFVMDRNPPLQAILVTSAEPTEGKSTVVANLGESIARSGRRTILVDAQLRLPALHRAFGLPNRVGLTSVLEGTAQLEDAISETSIPGVHVLTSGPLPYRPSELLSTKEFPDLIERLRDQYDMVLLDSPSVLAVVDAIVLARLSDGVLMVVERGRSQQEKVRLACQQLLDVKAELIGLVVNGSEPSKGYEHYMRMPTSTKGVAAT